MIFYLIIFCFTYFTFPKNIIYNIKLIVLYFVQHLIIYYIYHSFLQYNDSSEVKLKKLYCIEFLSV